MDSFALPAPIKIEDEDDDDLIIDLECAIISPQKVVTDWDADIRKMIFKHMTRSTECFLDDLMLKYIKSLKGKAIFFEEKVTLRGKILHHLNFFHMCYLETGFMKTSNYLENMEEILTLYCNLEIEIISTLKKKNNNKLEIKKAIAATCRQISYALSTYLHHEEAHILHVFIKMDNILNVQICRNVMQILYLHFLSELPPQEFSDEAFCRSYILFQKWKQICKPEEHDVMDKILYLRYKQTPESVKQNNVLNCILTSSNRNNMDFVSQLLNTVQWSSDAYFNYMKNKKSVDSESELNFDIEEEGLKDESFNQSLNEVVNSFSRKISQESTSNDDNSLLNNDSEDDDNIIIIDDDDDDENSCKENRQGEKDTPVCVIEDNVDDDIKEIIFVSTKSKEQNRNKKKDHNKNASVPVSSFLDSISNIPKVTSSSKTSSERASNSKTSSDAAVKKTSTGSPLKSVSNILPTSLSSVNKNQPHRNNKFSYANTKSTTNSIEGSSSVRKQPICAENSTASIEKTACDILTKPADVISKKLASIALTKVQDKENDKCSVLVNVEQDKDCEMIEKDDVNHRTLVETVEKSVAALPEENLDSEGKINSKSVTSQSISCQTDEYVHDIDRKCLESDISNAFKDVNIVAQSESREMNNCFDKGVSCGIGVGENLIETAKQDKEKAPSPVVDVPQDSKLGLSRRPFKTPAERKEIPPLPLDYDSSSKASLSVRSDKLDTHIDDVDAASEKIVDAAGVLDKDSEKMGDTTVEFVCKKCTDCNLHSAESEHSKTVKIQTETEGGFDNCTYFYGIVTPPSEHQSTESQTVQDSCLDLRCSGDDNEAHEDSDKTPQQSPQDIQPPENFITKEQPEEINIPRIINVSSLSEEVAEENVMDETDLQVASEDDDRLNTKENSIDAQGEETTVVLSNSESLVVAKSIDSLNCESSNAIPPVGAVENAENVSYEEVESANVCTGEVVEQSLIEINAENAQDVVYFDTNGANIVEAAFSLAENEVEVNRNEFLQTSITVEEHEIDANDMVVHEIVIEDTKGLVFDSSGVCQNLYYVVDGHLVPYENFVSEVTVKSDAEKETSEINVPAKETPKAVCLERDKILEEPVKPDQNLQPSKTPEPVERDDNSKSHKKPINKHLNGARLHRPAKNRVKPCKNKVMFTSSETIKAVSLDTLSTKDSEDFSDVWSSPVTRINGIASNEEFFNSGCSDFNAEGTKAEGLIKRQDSRSNSPVENSPACEPVSDFQDYYKKEMKMSITSAEPGGGASNSRLRRILNKKSVYDPSSNTSSTPRRSKKRKTAEEESSQSKKRVKFDSVVSLYNYPAVPDNVPPLIRPYANDFTDVKLVKLVPAVVLPKCTKEELLEKAFVTSEYVRRKQTQKQYIDEFLKRRTKSNILERVVFDKSDENNVKVYKVHPTPEPCRRTVPSPQNQTNAGKLKKWESSYKIDSIDNYKPTMSSVSTKRNAGQSKKSSASECTNLKKPTKRKRTTYPKTSPRSSLGDLDNGSYFNEPVRPHFNKML